MKSVELILLKNCKASGLEGGEKVKFLVCAPEEVVGKLVKAFEKRDCLRDGPSICEGTFKCISLKTPNDWSWNGILQKAKEMNLELFIQSPLVGLSFFCPIDSVSKAKALAGTLWNLERILGQNGGQAKNGRKKSFK